MKISKEELKQIIKEELSTFGKDVTSKSDASANLKKKMRDMSAQQGVDNRERGIIQRMEQNLAKLADLTDIKSGSVFSTLKKLNTIIEDQIEKLEGSKGKKDEE